MSEPLSAKPPLFSPALVTDLYELTMLQAYLEEGMGEVAVFSLFVRRLPKWRDFSLEAARAHAGEEMRRLPPRVRGLEPSSPPYAVELSPALEKAGAALRHQYEPDQVPR